MNKEQKPAKITLLGSNSGRNAGDAAILAAIMGSLEKEIDGPVQFEVPTTHPNFVSSNYGDMFDVKPINVMPWTGSVRLLGIPTFRSIARTDMILITDGIIFDINLFNPLFNYLITLVFLVPFAKLFGKKVICYNCGIGPLNSFWGRLFAKWVGNLSDLITVRDEDSLKLFREIGVTKEIHLTADAVFINWGVDEQRTEEILQQEGISEQAKAGELLGVNVTRYVDRWLKSSEKVSSKEAFLPMLAKSFAQLRKDKGISPVIIITQIMDLDYGKKLQELITQEVKTLTGEDYTPSLLSNATYSNHEILSVMGRCEILTGTRLHSLIISSRAGTPVVGMVYAPKVRSFLKQLETPEYAIELKDISIELMVEKLERAWDERESVRKTQQAVAEKLSVRARKATLLLRDVFYPGRVPQEVPEKAVVNN